MKNNKKKAAEQYKLDALNRFCSSFQFSTEDWINNSRDSYDSSSEDDYTEEEAELDMKRMMLRFRMKCVIRWFADATLDDNSLLLNVSGTKCRDMLKENEKSVTVLLLSDCDGEVRFFFGNKLDKFKTIWDYDIELMTDFLVELFDELLSEQKKSELSED